MQSRAQKLGSRESAVALARAAASGDQSARRRMAERLLDRVGVALRYLAAGDPELDDHVQNAMIEILRSAGSYRGDSSLEVWAERIAIRTAMRQIRKRRWRSRFMVYDSTHKGCAPGPAPERMTTRHRVSSRIAELLEELGPERRAVVTLRLVLGHSIEETAEITGAKINTVRDRLAVARRLMRERIRNDPVLAELREEIGCEEP